MSYHLMNTQRNQSSIKFLLSVCPSMITSSVSSISITLLNCYLSSSSLYLTHHLAIAQSPSTEKGMAAAVMGEAFLSASVQTLLHTITSSEFRDFLTSRKLKVWLLDELKMTLLMLNAVLNDAEKKQITDRAVKEWLDELKDAIFDAEDLVDEINTYCLRCKVEEDSQNVADKVRSFFSSSFGQFYWGMNSKLEAMSRRLEHFAKQKDVLGLQSVSLRAHKMSTTSFVNESVMVGRDGDKEKLLNMLLSDEDENDIGVVTILGMGGVGKTALAQLLYNDKRVQEKFDLKAWACVSEDFNVYMVTKNLVESVTSKVYNGHYLDLLRVDLKNSLSGKKFLFVLDDLWNEKYGDWDDLITPFSSGKRGSKIIVTTRQQRVAEVTRTFPIHKLRPLSYDNCWYLLAKHAFANEEVNRYPELEAIGRQIARKCGGLPIAAKTLGGLLRSKKDAKEWNKILDSNLWELPHDDVIPALRLSYLYLPSHLKKCFAYCSIFPKDHLLDRKRLVLLWMAEGFVQQDPHGKRTLEMEANDYFDELLSRSLVQQYEGAKEKFIMHDLVNDLAKVVSGKSCLWFGGKEIPKTIRHLSYRMKVCDASKKLESFYELHHLRTFLPQSYPGPCYLIAKTVLHNLLPKLKYLRVLSFSRYTNITELPLLIGNLVHLRYLDLSYTGIKRLPDSICVLYNLQTLILSSCKSFIELPDQIGNLIHLRHLDISDTNLKEMPTQISRLQHLCSLSAFVVGRQQNGLRLKELNKFRHLQGKLSISKLQNVVDSMDAFEANLKSKEQIEELMLEWSNDTEDSQIEKDVLDKLQPSTNLRRLTIKYYGGTSFPSWVGDSSFSNITFLSISDCNYCLSLPPFGQLPSLKELLITRMSLVQTIGPELYCSKVESFSFQPFPSLEILEFEEMPYWEEWLPSGGEGTKFPFPRLKRLHLVNCPKLRRHLPNHLPSLTEVHILECNQLEVKSSALHWNTSIEEIEIGEGAQSLLWVLDDDSQCLLKNQEIEKCDSLQSLPRMILGSNCLQYLTLKSIQSLLSFPEDGLPTSLLSLKIRDCEQLEFLPQEAWKNYTSLEDLAIENSCHSLKSFPLGCFPSLKDLTVWCCPNLESFTQVGGSALNLVIFHVFRCKKLKSMSGVQIGTLTALEFILLSNLPNLESLPQNSLPSKLRSITITDCKGLSSLAIADWGFQRLASLSILFIGGDGCEDIVQNLLKERVLPTSLKRLSISCLSNLKLLEGKGLQHLTSLEELEICNCPNIESLPEDKLPSSLLLLHINGCPKLEERYGNQRGKHWSKIAHIPTIRIDEEIII